MRLRNVDFGLWIWECEAPAEPFDLSTIAQRATAEVAPACAKASAGRPQANEGGRNGDCGMILDFGFWIAEY